MNSLGRLALLLPLLVLIGLGLNRRPLSGRMLGLLLFILFGGTLLGLYRHGWP